MEWKNRPGTSINLHPTVFGDRSQRDDAFSVRYLQTCRSCPTCRRNARCWGSGSWFFRLNFSIRKKNMSGLWFEEAIFVDDLMIGFVWRDFFVWSSGDMYIWYMCKNMFMYLNVWKCVIDSRYTHIFACSAHTLHCSYVYSSFHWYVLEFFQTFVTSFFF